MFIGGKKMKKALPFLLCAALLAGCSNGAANTETEPETKEETKEETDEEVQTVGVYTIYNATGEGVTELYLYPTGAADKGENYAAGGHGFGDAHAKILRYDAAENTSVELTLEFTTASGYTNKFETLHIETAPITLIAAEDAQTGSTPISFASSTANYTIYNTTGEEVTELYMYRTGSSDKGENLIDGAKENGGSQVISYDAVPEFLLDEEGNMGAFTLEFTTASGYTGKFETLSYEVAPICLISADDVTGATQIKFGAPAN